MTFGAEFENDESSLIAINGFGGTRDSSTMKDLFIRTNGRNNSAKSAAATQQSKTSLAKFKKKSMDINDILAIPEISYLILSYLLVESDPVIFGSMESRMNWVLASKCFAASFKLRASLAKRSRFVGITSYDWTLCNRITPCLVLKDTSVFPSYDQWTHILSTRSVSELHLDQCTLHWSQLATIANSFRDIACNPTKLSINQCTLILADGNDQNSNTSRSAAFVQQAIFPFSSFQIVEITYPTLCWSAENLEDVQLFHTNSLEPSGRSHSSLELSLTAESELGTVPHLYFYYLSQASECCLWNNVKFVYSHSNVASILSHHHLDPVPIYLDRSFFRELGLVLPYSNRLDSHSIVWEQVRTRNHGSVILIDRLEDINEFIFQKYDGESHRYYSCASDVIAITTLNQHLLSNSRRGIRYS